MSGEVIKEESGYDGSGIVPPYILERLRRARAVEPDIGAAAEKLAEIDDNEGEDNE